MIHELRIYHCVPGRLPALLKRFETITLALWERHGIRQAGFWTTEIGPSNQDLYYLLEGKSLAERDEKWTTFQSDPEWIAKRAKTEKDGAIVASLENTILKPTGFSSIKGAGQLKNITGMDGEIGTVAILINSIRCVIESSPGFVTMQNINMPVPLAITGGSRRTDLIDIERLFGRR